MTATSAAGMRSPALISQAERDLGTRCVPVFRLPAFSRIVPFPEMEPARWRQVLDVNIDGTFRMSIAAGGFGAEMAGEALVRDLVDGRRFAVGQHRSP